MASLLSEMSVAAQNRNGEKVFEVGELEEGTSRLPTIFDVNSATCPAVDVDASALNRMVLVLFCLGTYVPSFPATNQHEDQL